MFTLRFAPQARSVIGVVSGVECRGRFFSTFSGPTSPNGSNGDTNNVRRSTNRTTPISHALPPPQRAAAQTSVSSREDRNHDHRRGGDPNFMAVVVTTGLVTLY